MGAMSKGWPGHDRRTRAAWLRYAAALALVLGAALASDLFHPWMGSAPQVVFLAAVAVSAWLGGTGPAVIAAALSLAALSLMGLEPFGAWSFGGPDFWALGAFLLASALLVVLSDRRDRAEAALQARERNCAAPWTG